MSARARISLGRFVVLGLSLVVLDSTLVGAQSRGAGPASRPASPAGQPAAPGAPASNGGAAADATAATSRVQERSVNLSRSQIDAATQQRAAATSGNGAPRKRGLAGFGNVVTGALKGDENREEAAKGLLQAEASSEAALGKTVLVVIGGEDERDKVKESLAEVQRNVTILFVDDSVSDERYDNSALHGGISGKVKGMATNLWVYFPSSGGSGQRKPNQVLSTKVAAPSLWTGVFAADGDAPPQLTNALNGQGFRSNGSGAGGAVPAAGPAAPSAATAPIAATGGAIAEGDVLAPKIPGIRLLAQPSEASTVVATLGKADQVVVIGGERNGYINVQGTVGAGWVNAKLFNKQ